MYAIKRQGLKQAEWGPVPAGPATGGGRSRGRRPRRRPEPQRSGGEEAVAWPAEGEPARRRAGSEEAGTAKREARMLARGGSLMARNKFAGTARRSAATS